MRTACKYQPRQPRRPLAIAVAVALGIAAVPAGAITVTDGGDNGTGSTCTLRQAINLASTGATTSACTAGASIDVIDFAPALAGATIGLSAGELEIKEYGLSIDGSGQIIDAQGNSRVLYVDGDATLNDLTFTGGSAQATSAGPAMVARGGGIYLERAGTLELTNVAVINNTAARHGGGIFAEYLSQLTLTHSRVSGNTAQDKGGGILAYSDQLEVSDSTINNNQAINGYGGGILVSALDGQATIAGSSIIGNTAGGLGGGIRAKLGGNGSLEILDTTVAGNHTDAQRGGGLDLAVSSIAIGNSTIRGNTAKYRGAGLSVRPVFIYDIFLGPQNHPFDLSVVGSTVTGNATTYTGSTYTSSGAGIFADMNVTSYLGTSSASIANTIVAGNSAQASPDIAASDPGSPDITAQASLLGTALQSWFGGAGLGNVFHDDPGLGPLTTNGGPTWTMVPQSGSPALDAGDNSLIPVGLSHDQRGVSFPRIYHAVVDIGAVEANAVDRDRIFHDGFDVGTF